MNDDLDDDIMADEDGFDEFSQSGGLGDTLRQNPMAKVGVVVAGVAALAGALLLFGGDSQETAQSTMIPPSEVVSTPGSDEEVDPVYIEAVERENQEDLERAQRESGSTIPVPTGSPETRLEVPEVEAEADDPLHRWRALQEERISRDLADEAVDVEPVTVLDAEQQNEAIQALAESMLEQMRAVLTENSSEKTFTTKTLISYSSGNGNGSGNSSGGGGNGGNGNGGQDSDNMADFDFEEEEEVIIPAGKVVYGQTLLEVNSDVPTTVLAQMVSGPLKGWKLLGTFSVLEDIGLIGIEFETAVNEEGDMHNISAILLDPDTTLAGQRTSINRRYLRRVVYPAAAAFIEGFADAIAETDEDVTVVDGAAVQTTEESDTEDAIAEGIREAASGVTDIINQQAQVPVRIIIAAGTPIGVFFIENVIEENPDDEF